MKWILLTLVLILPFVGLSNERSIAQTDCTFTLETEEPVQLWATPIGGWSNVYMQPNVPYPIVRYVLLGEALAAYEFQIEEGVTGWYEHILLGTRSEGCNLSFERGDVADFPLVCEATVIEPSMVFSWAALIETGSTSVGGSGIGTYSNIPVDRTFLTVRPTAVSATIYYAHGWTGGALASHHLEFDPACPERPFITTITAQTLEGARLWSNPHVELGEVTADVPANITFEVMAGPVTSIISEDGITTGEWILVRNATYGTGWMWSERLQLSTPFPPESIGEAIAMAETRVWSAPDAQTGTYLGDIIEDLPVRLLIGPVEGFIRTDTDDVGEWYWIQTGNRAITGWVWAGRLEILPDEE